MLTATEKLHLTRDIREYTFVAQSEITIDQVDDAAEFLLTDVLCGRHDIYQHSAYL